MSGLIISLLGFALLFLVFGIFFVRGKMTKNKKKIDGKMPSVPFYAFQLRWIGVMFLVLSVFLLITVVVLIINL